MPYLQKPVELFDKGIISELGDESIPAGSASASINFLNLGDRIELVRGQNLLGDSESSTGNSGGVFKAVDTAGNEHIFKKIGTKLRHLSLTTDTWEDVITGLPEDEPLSAAPYRTPAGSFLWLSSPNSGLYRINLANPTSYYDFYDANKNFKGWITIKTNRMWLWGDVGNSAADVGNEVIVRLSWIDNDWPYTEISSEAYDTADGSATYANALAQDFIVGRTLSIVHSQETFTDNGDGTLTGDNGGSGTINYTTGDVSVTFGGTAPSSGAITANYAYEKPTDEGIADFSYSSPRQAGEGAFFFQGEGSDPIQTVIGYDGDYYCFHKRSIWKVDLTEDDTNATNRLYRENTGIPFLHAAVAVGEGIFYIDTVTNEVRILKYNEISSRVVPETVSNQLDTDDYVFDNAHFKVFNDFIVITCRSSENVTFNDLILLYNKKWKLWDTMDALYEMLEVYNDKLYGGSSVNHNVYQLFTGFDDDEGLIAGVWEANEGNLDIAELKKLKRFVVWGDMSSSQELIIDVAYDNGAYAELGRIAGDSDYVDASVLTQYGTTLYGSGAAYGSGETVEAARYMREFRLRSDKFERIKIRFRTEEFGYLNIRGYNFRDIRKVLYRVPHKFR